MTNYVFVTASLPALTFGQEPEIRFDEFLTLARENLHPSDMAELEKIQQLIDLYNLSALWRGEPIDHRGTLSRTELEEEEAYAVHFPPYLTQFLDQYEETEERIAHHGWLIARYFQEAIASSEGFLRRYYSFEREWRLVMLGMRARQLGRDVTRELQFEDPSDPIVAQIIAQRDAREFEPPEGYEPLKEFLGHDPRTLHHELEQYRFSRVSEMVEQEIFSLERVLGFMVRLMIVERNWELEQVA
jgi:Protein of unknown function (DUF2764)